MPGSSPCDSRQARRLQDLWDCEEQEQQNEQRTLLFQKLNSDPQAAPSGTHAHVESGQEKPRLLAENRGFIAVWMLYQYQEPRGLTTAPETAL